MATYTRYPIRRGEILENKSGYNGSKTTKLSRPSRDGDVLREPVPIVAERKAPPSEADRMGPSRIYKILAGAL